MSDLPRQIKLFEPPPEQKVVPRQPDDYVGVYCVGSHITVVTKQPAGFVMPKVDLWHPVFDCELPAELSAADNGRYFTIWFAGIPSERGQYGRCVREIRVTGIAKAIEGRDLRPDERVRYVAQPSVWSGRGMAASCLHSNVLGPAPSKTGIRCRSARADETQASPSRCKAVQPARAATVFSRRNGMDKLKDVYQIHVLCGHNRKSRNG
jgi:hypothetical protein